MYFLPVGTTNKIPMMKPQAVSHQSLLLLAHSNLHAMRDGK